MTTRWDLKRKAMEGDAVVFADKPRLESFTRRHIGHKGIVKDSKYMTTPTGLTPKRKYLIHCNSCEQQEWITSTDFNKA